MQIFKSRPHFVEKIWASDKLSKIKKRSGPIGESWEVSSLDEGESLINDRPLRSYQDLLGRHSFVAKYLCTQGPLSVQVHPGGKDSKAECWIILNAADESGIYMGLKKGVDKNRLREVINSDEDVVPLLQYVPVKRGDFYFLPERTVHALGKNLLLLEIQQNSGVTFRLWDWNRRDSNGQKRALHIEEGLEAINFNAEANTLKSFLPQSNIFKYSKKILIDHKDFRVTSYNIKKKILLDSPLRSAAIFLLNGTLQVRRGRQIESLNAFETILLSPQGDKVELLPDRETLFVIVD